MRKNAEQDFDGISSVFKCRDAKSGAAVSQCGRMNRNLLRQITQAIIDAKGGSKTAEERVERASAAPRLRPARF